ncbi:hypothetical protein ACN47E_009010 [Coniothyrium glycines]
MASDIISIESDSDSDPTAPTVIALDTYPHLLLYPSQIPTHGRKRKRAESAHAPHVPAQATHVEAGAFPFLKLPAELRLRVYQHLLPHDLVISFTKLSNDAKDQDWPVIGIPRYGDASVVYSVKAVPRTLRRRNVTYVRFNMQTQLFFVSKFVYNEARAVLYGGNTYQFVVDGDAHQPRSLRSPLIFGPFGSESGLPLLRNLRSIKIKLPLNCQGHMSLKRQRARLEYFVEVLRDYADDENRNSLLQELTVNVDMDPSVSDLYGNTSHLHPAHPAHDQSVVEKYMFGLDGLTSLRGIKDVEINGLPEWYAKCLQLCVQSKGGEPEETNWPLIEVKRRRPGASYGPKLMSWVTTRKWHQPKLNWKGYAERNEVPLPDDIDKFWMT